MPKLPDATTVYIYALIDPRNSAVRYVGQSTRPLTRFDQHVKGKALNRRAAWVAELWQAGYTPVMKVIESSTRAIANERERHWIDHHLASGADLLNITFVKQLRKPRFTAQDLIRSSNPDDSIYIRVSEAARRLNVTRDAVYKAVAAGDLRTETIFGTMGVLIEDVERYSPRPFAGIREAEPSAEATAEAAAAAPKRPVGRPRKTQMASQDQSKDAAQ